MRAMALSAFANREDDASAQLDALDFPLENAKFRRVYLIICRVDSEEGNLNRFQQR